ncbi:MAG: hypothetical protein ACTHMQ_10870 [Protaetiibacter sp.]
MIDEWGRLFQALWLVVGPLLAGSSWPVLAAIGAGLAIVAAIGIVLAIVARAARDRGGATVAAPFRPRVGQRDSRPQRADFSRFSARPRAPGAALV